MYFEDYGDQKQAMQLYAKLELNADACVNCAAACQGSCPQGIPIQERLIGAHEQLKWA
jgi:predicted aldo/keto reductase-like oxidoreductase